MTSIVNNDIKNDESESENDDNDTVVMTSSERRRRQRLESKVRKRLQDPIAQAQVRQSAVMASERILKAAASLQHRQCTQKSTATAGTAILPNIPSFDLSVASSSSMTTAAHHNNINNNNNQNIMHSADIKSIQHSDDHASERATRRGRRRGSRERNEAISLLEDIGEEDYDFFHADDTDLHTLTTGITTEEGGKEYGRRRSKKTSSSNKRHSKSKHKLSNNDKKDAKDAGGGNNNNNDDAWMCGVCGQVFATFDAADKHEKDHIHEVVWGLGWHSNQHQQQQQHNRTPSGSCLTHSSSTPLPQPPVSEIFRRRTHSEDQGGPSSNRMTASSEQQQRQRQRQHSFDLLPSLTHNNRSDNVHRQPTTSRYFDEWEKTVGRKMDQPSPPRSRTMSALKQQQQQQQQQHSDLIIPARTGALIPKPRARTNSEVRFASSKPQVIDPLFGGGDVSGNADLRHHHRHHNDVTLLLSRTLRDSVVLADEALLDVSKKAESMILTNAEVEAERELALLAADKAYYDDMAAAAVARRANPAIRYRSDGQSLLGKIQNKFVDAYQIMKQGDAQTGMKDQYTRKKREGEGDDVDIEHTDRTLYVNVMVKNSVQVVRHELERLAGQRWETNTDEVEKLGRFERFRVFAHVNMVKLAGIALASDFTPRRIAIQLSNDLYRLLTPRLRRRGVTIETEIEYRVGPYFVLAVNIKSIDWKMLVKATHKDVALRKKKWADESKLEVENEESEEEGLLRSWCNFFVRIYETPRNDILANVLYWMYYLHFAIYVPICYIAYYTFLGSSIRKFILMNVSNEIFYYVEEKGMEMEIGIRTAAKQAAFMLSALREIRAGDRALEKRRQESKQQEKGIIIGPLLGPAVKADAGPAVKPEGFEVPPNLEFVGLELDLPVGFRRLRWALLSQESKFVLDGIYRTEAKYDDITLGEWDKHAEYIGATDLPDSVDPKDFIGATKTGSYMMPRSAFVAANMCYETHYIEAYNDYCFCLKKSARNPDAPFGKSFIAWTQYLVINLGSNSSRLYCSVEAEFPNGEPMVSRQIRSGMRAGTGELFVLIGETIAKYADEYP